MTTVEILKEMAFTATETQRRALEDAISVLSAEGDLISRQAVENITWEEPSYSDPLNVLTEVREKVRALPSVENKGEWIIYGFPSSEQIKNCTEDYYCSECKFVVSRFESRACNFCPNCGADMRGET